MTEICALTVRKGGLASHSAESEKEMAGECGTDETAREARMDRDTVGNKLTKLDLPINEISSDRFVYPTCVLGLKSDVALIPLA